MDGGFLDRVQSFLQSQDIAYGFEAPVGQFTVISFEATEEVNALYAVRVELASGDPNVDLHALIDTQCSLSIHCKYSETRYWTGIVETAERSIL